MILKTIYILIILIILVCGCLYLFQERLIFFPQKLPKSYRFSFHHRAEEKYIKTSDGIFLHGLLFRASQSKGLIFYLHGNAGSLSIWGEVAKTYTDLHYDVFILDYRGYGKSEGAISGQKQLFKDIQTAYGQLKKYYAEDRMVVLGYSMGTGLASKLASSNQPRLLILQAPYYSITDLMRRYYPYLPTFLLKYKLETNQYLRQCSMPVVIFHGDLDQVIYYGSSLKLAKEFKKQDRLITLAGIGHNGITDSREYKRELATILE